MIIVRITWLDSAAAHNRPWIADNETVRALKCSSVGFLIEKNRREVIIAQSLNANQRGNVYAIPTSSIRKMRRLK